MNHSEKPNSSDFQIRVSNPRPIPGPSPIAMTQANDYYQDHCNGGFANPYNGECFLIRTDNSPTANLPEDYRLARVPDLRIYQEWLWEFFNSN